MLAKGFCVRLTGSFRKDDIIERMMEMVCIGALQPESKSTYDDIGLRISYLNEDMSFKGYQYF